MADAVFINASTGATSTRPLTQQEQAVASADAASATQNSQQQQAATSRAGDATDALTQLISLAGGSAAVRSKLKAVLAGTDTLTNAQAQRLLAAVALVVLRDRADT